MLQITIPASVYEQYDEESNEFIYTVVGKDQTIKLEHSLVSISKWEAKWCKPFFSKNKKSREEILDYIKFMTLTQNVDPEVYERLTSENVRQIDEYLEAPMTATTVSGDGSGKGKKGNEVVTSEVIYYWMIALEIPVEFQKWHINRLLMLVRVCSAKNQPAKKMSKRDIMAQNAALNEARKKQLNTRG